MFMNRKDKEELRLYRTALGWLSARFGPTDLVGLTQRFVEGFRDKPIDKEMIEILKKAVRQAAYIDKKASEISETVEAERAAHAYHIRSLIAEWRRGCGNTTNGSSEPIDCAACTGALISAIDHAMKRYGRKLDAPETMPGAKLFEGFDERPMPRFNETRPFAGLTPVPDRAPPGHMDGHNPPPGYPRPPTPPSPPRAADKRNTVEISVSELKRLNTIEADAAVPFYDHVTGLALEKGDVFITSTNYWKALNAASERLTTVEADRDIARDQLKRAEAESRSLLRVAFDASSFCAISLSVLERYARFPWAKGVANIDALVAQLDLSLRRQFKVLQPFYAVEAQKEVEDRLQSTIDHSKAEYPT